MTPDAAVPSSAAAAPALRVDGTAPPLPATAPPAGAPQPAPRRRQLHMKRPYLDDLPEIAVPAAYTLRTYRPGDEAAWGEIMNSPQGIGTEWTPEKARERLIDKPQFRAGGLFFATSDAESGRPVASACAWRKDPAEQALGTLHMVAALPEHRGRGLGRLVCLAVLHYFQARGFRTVDLSTDDFRVPAIKSYLGLGFVPVYPEDPTGFDDHEARWCALFQTILGRS